MGAWNAFDTPEEPAVYVAGGAFDVEPVLPQGTRVLRGTPSELASEPVIALTVLDTRTTPLGILSRIRHSTRLKDTPALVIAEHEDDSALHLLDANDVLAPPFTSIAAANRVRTLVDLGRARGLLRQRQTFDQAILDGVDVGIITTDARGYVTFVNRCARDVLHRTDDLGGENVCTLLGLQHDPETLLQQQADKRWEHVIHSPEGDVEIHLAVSRAHETMQQHLGFFFIFHDRTHEKQLEMERRRFERLAAMGTMVAGFAHEVRNPVASLRSIAEALNEELTEASLRLPHVDRMLQVLERIERLVRTSLLFGRPSPPRPSAHPPAVLLSAAASSLQPRTRPMGCDFCIEADPDLPDVFVDDGQIVQALVIFLNNALDATGSPRRVHLRAQYLRPSNEPRRRSDLPPAPYVRFDVRDDGPGIPPEIMGRIFDPFFTTKATGTGLGLSIAQQLVTENGARIELTSAVGGGTTFSVLAPLASQ